MRVKCEVWVKCATLNVTSESVKWSEFDQISNNSHIDVFDFVYFERTKSGKYVTFIYELCIIKCESSCA